MLHFKQQMGRGKKFYGQIYKQVNYFLLQILRTVCPKSLDPKSHSNNILGQTEECSLYIQLQTRPLNLCYFIQLSFQ